MSVQLTSNPSLSDKIRQQYSTFSGTDVVLMLGDVEVGTATAYVVNVRRSKVPQFTFGDPDPKAITRGKRQIDGQITGIMMHQDNFIAAMNQIVSAYTDKSSWIYHAGQAFIQQRLSLYASMMNADQSSNQAGGSNPGATGGNYFISNITDPNNVNQVLTQLIEFAPINLDELLPIDAVLVGVNENGQAGISTILAMEFTDHANAFSSDTTAAIEQASFVARDYIAWQPLQ